MVPARRPPFLRSSRPEIRTPPGEPRPRLRALSGRVAGSVTERDTVEGRRQPTACTSTGLTSEHEGDQGPRAPPRKRQTDVFVAQTSDVRVFKVGPGRAAKAREPNMR